jgi:hypothetical protein
LILRESPDPEDVPVFGQHAVSYSHNVHRDPVPEASRSRDASMDDDKVAVGHDHARLIHERRGSILDEVEETVAAWLNVGAVLDVVG